MILIFDLANWLLFATHLLVMMIFIFISPTMHHKITSRAQTGFTETYAQSLSVDCDLDLLPSTKVLVRDTSFVMMIICATLFIITPMHDKFMGRT